MSELQCDLERPRLQEHRASNSESTVVPTLGDVEKSNSNSAPADVDVFFPEGGREAWMTMAGAWMVQFCTFGYINEEFIKVGALPLSVDYYTRHFLENKTPADVSWIGSFQFAIQYAFGALIERGVDAGYFHYMIIGSSFYVICISLLSLTHHGQFYQVFLAQGVGMGIFSALIFFPSFTIVSHHFKRRRTVAMAVVTSGAACGGVLFPIMLNQIGSRTHFTTAIRATGGIIAALLLFANCFHESRAVLSVFKLTIIVGRLVNMTLSLRVGPFNLVIASLYACSIFTFAMLGMKHFAALVVFAFLYGFTSGAYAALMPANMLTLNRIRLVIVFSVVAPALLVENPVSGALLGSAEDLKFRWPPAVIFNTVMVAAASGGTFISIARILYIRRKGTGQLV
ncbi:hypothetical protein B0H19DRAFT_1085225 [Mycena capillaripes]|nr:hypothetical protein B0H19DRAFT_1085225 [Mycena capillaripes]